MDRALYRKYRSKKFSEVIGQEHITKTLENAIKTGRISHAYLFTGPRGVGKTTIARILAHEVNSLPYTDESVHLDIIEIDAASNRRIDEIRDIRERVHIAPTSAKYKVYIIDEVHMLTREAFNALLKTLEEPPAHCIFILATTEAYKLPETIISRTQRFEFKSIPTGQAAKHLGVIAKQESIDIEPAALELLAYHGEGSFRDSISLLDQLAGTGKTITTDLVGDFLGLPSNEGITAIIDSIDRKDSKQLLKTLDQIIEHGANPAAIAEMIAFGLRAQIVSSGSRPEALALLKNLLEVPASNHPQEYLEICLLEAAAGETVNKPDDNKTDKPKNESKDEESVKDTQPKQSSGAPASAPFSIEDWPQVLDEVKSHAASLYSALKLAKPKLESQELTLVFEFPLHHKKINQAANKEMLAGLIEELQGARIAIKCVVDKEQFKKISAENKSLNAYSEDPLSPAQLKTINNIFGSSEVLES